MKKRTFVSIFFSIALCAVQGQNLVPNYSFENLIKCTAGEGQFNGYVADWTGQTGSNTCLSLYTHQCPGDSVGGGSVPYNFFDGTYYSFQYAHSGVSYGSLLTFVSGGDSTYPYGNNPLFSNTRNYMQATLINSLNSGTRYYVTFYVNLTNGAWYSCGDIGAYFSDSALVFDNTGVGRVKSYLTPQVANNPKKQELNDTVNWMKITGSFLAKGGEQYIVIGNFKNDSLSSIKYLGQLSSVNAEATYYVDDVIVSLDSNYADSIESVPIINAPKESIKIYPNPANSLLNIEVHLLPGQEDEICIYNSLGEKVVCEQLTQNLTELPTNTLSQGIYYYRITAINGTLIKADKVMIVH